MTPEMMIKLRKSLVLHEGYRKFPYVDTKGKTTIGIGFNLTDRGIDDEWINKRYQLDVNYFFDKLNGFPWFSELNEDRQIALIDMSFMGWLEFLKFENFIAALESHDYSKAAYEMINSEWAKEVKNRVATLAQVILTGVYSL